MEKKLTPNLKFEIDKLLYNSSPCNKQIIIIIIFLNNLFIKHPLT